MTTTSKFLSFFIWNRLLPGPTNVRFGKISVRIEGDLFLYAAFQFVGVFIGVSIKSFSLTKILRRTEPANFYFEFFLLGKSLVRRGISYHSLTPECERSFNQHWSGST